jgi:hypothetical protein
MPGLPEATREIGSPPLRLAAAVLLLFTALALTGGSLLISWGVSREYGSGGTPFAVAAVIGLLAAAALAGMVALAGPRSRGVLIAGLAIGLVLGVASPIVGVTLGDREHRADLARERSACSAADRELLAALPFGPSPYAPAGSRDGSCGTELQFSGSRAAVATALTAAGWQGEETGTVYRRGGDTLCVAINEGELVKGLTVHVTIPPRG